MRAPAWPPTGLGPANARRVRSRPARAPSSAGTPASGHVVSIATAAQAAGPQRCSGVRGHLCGNGNVPRYGGPDGPLPSQCVATPRRFQEGRALRWSRGLWPGVACVPSLFRAASGRLRARLRPDSRGTRLREADPSRRGVRLGVGRKQFTTRSLPRKAGALPQSCHLPDLSLTLTPRPQRPGPFVFDSGFRGRMLSS